MTTSRDDAGPAQLHLDEATCTTTTATRQSAQSAENGTAVPLAVTILGPNALHDLARVGLRVVGVCRCCGAPLVNPASIARRLGPVCAARTERAA